MEVLLAAVLVDTAHAALENREHGLDGVGMHAATDLFADRVLSGPGTAAPKACWWDLVPRPY